MKILITAIMMMVFCYGLALGQNTLDITFDGQPVQPPDSQYIVTSYSESGMLFTSLPENVGFDRNANAGGFSFYPDNGSTYIQQTAGAPVIFSFTDGSLFGLDSVDLAGYSSSLPDFDVQFVGYHPDGSTVTTDLSGSGINFQTFDFTGFSDLSYVEISTPDWSLDNLVVSTPEPSVGKLFLVGSLLFGAVKLRRDRRAL